MILLTGRRPLRDLFSAGIDVEPVRRGRARLRLTPLVEDEAFTEVVLTLPVDGSGLDAVEVLDAGGNRMLYRFPRMQRNRGLPADLFSFKPPVN